MLRDRTTLSSRRSTGLLVVRLVALLRWTATWLPPAQLCAFLKAFADNFLQFDPHTDSERSAAIRSRSTRQAEDRLLVPGAVSSPLCRPSESWGKLAESDSTACCQRGRAEGSEVHTEQHWPVSVFLVASAHSRLMTDPQPTTQQVWSPEDCLQDTDSTTDCTRCTF